MYIEKIQSPADLKGLLAAISAAGSPWCALPSLISEPWWVFCGLRDSMKFGYLGVNVRDNYSEIMQKYIVSDGIYCCFCSETCMFQYCCLPLQQKLYEKSNGIGRKTTANTSA